LDVYRLSVRDAKKVFAVSKSFPGEAMETQSWLDHALTCGYISRDEYRAMDAAWQAIGGKLQKMIDRADTFCRPAPAR
jgi:four helix bundle protein